MIKNENKFKVRFEHYCFRCKKFFYTKVEFPKACSRCHKYDWADGEIKRRNFIKKPYGPYHIKKEEEIKNETL